MTKIHFISVTTVAFLSLFAASCGGGTTSDGTGTEVAMTAASGGTTTSEAVVASLEAPRNSLLARLEAELSPVRKAWAVPACSWSPTACSSGAETLSFNGCSPATDPAISITGSETLTWTAAGCCTASPLSAASGCSFTRRTIGSGGATTLVRAVGGNSVTLNTEDTSGYDQQKTGGFSVLCQGATCDVQRQITIVGAHYTGDSGRATWDHTVSTDSPLIVQGHDSSRQILSGTIRVQHNIAQMTSITTITSALTFTTNCCHPTGGSVTTTFSGGKLDGKSESMTFGPTCGAATLNDSKQQSTGLTLHHCL